VLKFHEIDSGEVGDEPGTRCARSTPFSVWAASESGSIQPNPPDKEHLEEEIYRQRKRFKLKNVNRWLGEKRNEEVYRGHYLVLLHWKPKALETLAGLDEEMLKKGMTSKRVHERNAAATLEAHRVPNGHTASDERNADA
jgi:hypothetical protein